MISQRIALAGALASLLFTTCTNPQDAPSAGDPDLPHHVRISDQISLAGQPTEKGLEKIKQAGFQTVIQIRSPKNASHSEKQIVESLDMDYTYIPAEGFNDELMEPFSSAVSDPSNKPLFLHCGRAQLVSGLWYAHRVLQDGIPDEEAFEEAKKLGLSHPKTITGAREYVRRKISSESTP